MRNCALLVLVVVFSGWSSGALAVPITNGLVAGYEFNGNANDVSGNGNDGVVNGATPTIDRFGNANSAYSFDGVDDYIISSETFAPQAAGSISLWVSRLGGSYLGVDNRSVISSRSDSGYSPGDFMLGTNEVNDFGVCYHNGFEWNCAEQLLADPSSSDWYHALWTWDIQDQSKFYVDGELIATAAVTDPIFGNLQIEIGEMSLVHSSNCCANFFEGSIDDVYIYNRALSSAEVSTLYSAVPEPNTALLLGIGMMGLSIRRRKAL